MSPEQARQHLERGGPGPISVAGRLDLTGTQLDTLPPGLECYDLDASDSQLRTLPSDICIESRLILDNCSLLSSLPENLTVGSLSARHCNSLCELPEGLSTWFLDLSDSRQFARWPHKATIGAGGVRLRNCVSMRNLPGWFGALAYLDLAGCSQIESLPEGLRVTGWVDVGGTELTSLPNSLAATQLRWRSVPVPQRVAFDPGSISADQALAERNAELRRVMIERMGYLRFSEEAGAQVLDEDTDPGGRRQLLRIDLDDDEPLVGLRCSCPSTGREYLLRVPPDTESCHQAWIAGFDDPNDYNPVIET